MISTLQYIDNQQNEMISLVQEWSAINSGSENLAGLALQLTALEKAFAKLGGSMSRIALPPRTAIDNKGKKSEIPSGEALRIKKHPEAPIQILFGGHYDTVFGPEHSFQKVKQVDDDTLKGPGVADMKGGLVVMLKALEALEQSPYAGKIGYEILLNPDEEIGSPSSEPLFREAAKRHQLGLIFEPSFPDGTLVSSRKGSVNYTFSVVGQAAHVGRNFYQGRSAIVSLARFIGNIEALNDPESGVSVNIGFIEGGGPVNIVPEFASCKVNIRFDDPDYFKSLNEVLLDLVEEASVDGITVNMYQTTLRKPKSFDWKSQRLFEAFKQCGAELGQVLTCQPSGGVCDGNILSAAGLPTLDTLGVVGGELHTSNEYIRLKSLKKRAQLTARFLERLASGKIDLKEKFHA